MTPPRDQQSVEEIVEHAAEVLQAGLRQDCNLPEFDGMAEFRRVITTALQSQSEKGRQWNQLLELQLKNLQSLYTELNAAVVGYLEMRVSYEELLPHLTLKGEEESPAKTGKTHNAALTAHDEALPGDWTVVRAIRPTPPPINSNGWALMAGDKEVLWDSDETSDQWMEPIAAAHNSALRLLVDALRQHQEWMEEDGMRSDDVPIHDCDFVLAPESGTCSFHELYAATVTALQPYSGQKDGK